MVVREKEREFRIFGSHSFRVVARGHGDNGADHNFLSLQTPDQPT
jgi:hypothetical protein